MEKEYLSKSKEQLSRLKEVASADSDVGLAAVLGIGAGSIANAKRRNSIPSKWFVIISTQFNVNIEWLVNGKGEKYVPLSDLQENPEKGQFVTQRTVPLVGLGSCGLKNWYNSGPISMRAPVPFDHEGELLFAVIAIGTSMQPEGIRQGFVVYCDPEVLPEKGDAVYIETNEGNCSIKKYMGQEGKWIHLQGWLEPDKDGNQKPYFEKLSINTVSRLSCVVGVKRKA